MIDQLLRLQFSSVILLLVLPLVSVGQTNNGFYFDHLAIEQGLSHNTVNTIIQDKFGYVWIGTDSGLNKFDGVSLTRVPSSQSIDIPESYIGSMITALLEDSQGGLWVGSRSHGVSYKAPHKAEFDSFYNHPELSAILGSEVYSIVEDNTKSIWICTIGAGLCKYNPETGDVIRYNTASGTIPTDRVFDIVQGSNDAMYLVTDQSGVFMLDESSGTFHQLDIASLSNLKGYRKRLVHHESHLWVASEGSGLFDIDLEANTAVNYRTDSSVSSISSNTIRDIIIEDNRVIFATDGAGIGTIDLLTGQTTSQRASQQFENYLNSDALLCLFKDMNKNLWIGTFNGGVNIYDSSKTRIDHFSGSLIANRLASKSILAFDELSGGQLIFGTDGGGIGMIDSSLKSIEISPINRLINGSIIKCLHVDNTDNVLWIGTYGSGLERLDLLSKEVTNYNYGENVLSNSSVWSLDQRSNGQLWIGTLGGGVNVFDPMDDSFIHFDHDPNDSTTLAEKVVVSVLVTEDDVPWVGTSSKGVGYFDDRNQSFTNFKHSRDDSTSLSNNNVRALHQDANGVIWIGTDGGGLNKYLGNQQFKSYKTDDGLMSNSIMSIEDDEQGYIWVSSLKGISRLDPESEQFVNFYFDGKEINQFNQQSSILYKGNLLFGGINGIHSINTAKVQGDVSDNPITFTSLYVLNKQILPNEEHHGVVVLDQALEDAEEIELSYRDKSITLHFTTFDFVGKSFEPYYYFLEGFNEEWQVLDKDAHSITYTNLDPGKYLLKVTRGNAERQLRLIVKPPFWETTWFRLLILLLSLGLLKVGYDFLQRRQKERHEKELLDAQSKILALKNEKLETEIDANNSKLLFSTTQMAHKNTILIGVKAELEKIQDEKKISLRKTIRVLESELQSGDYWNEFNIYFDKIDKNLLKSLVNEYPVLTKNDLRLCGLLRLNLNTKEIASLLNISLRGVEKAKYRLKKKLGLTAETNLDSFIQLYNVKK